MSLIVFGPDQLAAAVKQADAAVPPGHTNALVGTVDSTGAQVLLTMKMGTGGWTASGIARHDWSGDNQIGASVVYSW